ncbi:Oxidoreductase, molybdopterin-binding [Olavius sp. associated proteobacterium Delta 1]|nr:Oxidoreductase, molybdopterin-binding [Olavius sp. associated proteobacterium Delta 1]
MQNNRNKEVKRAICFGCWLQAGVLATIEDGRVTKLKGEPGHPVNQGWICERSKAFIEHLYHEDRLNYPLKRVGERGAGKWQKISWQDALDEVAEKLDLIKAQSGAEAVASIGGTGRGFSELFKVRFMNLFGSPNHANAGQWCSVVSRQIHAAIHGAGASRAVKPPCKCAVIWGGNPAESFACIFPQHTKAKRRGTQYIIIDPKYSETAGRLADHWLKLRPGTDAALALGWIHVIIEEKLYDKEFVANWCHGFEELKERVKKYTPARVAEITRLPEKQIVDTARLYATSKPASIIWGVKSDMQGRNVTGITHAKCVLRAITGNLDVVGGDMLAGPCEKVNYGTVLEHMHMLPAEQRKKQLGAEDHKLWCFPGYEMVEKSAKPYWYGKGLSAGFLPGCHEPAVWTAILEGEPYPVRGLVCGACNPLVAFPNTKRIYRALKSRKLELFVVAEQWMTPSAMLADYVFPITNWLEHPQLYTQTFQGSGSAAALGQRIVAPLYERRTDFEFYRGLGLRLGQDEYWRESLEKEWDWCLEPLLKELGLENSEEFATKQHWWSSPVVEKRYATIDPATGRPKGFATPTGKVELYSTILDKLGYDPLPYYEEPPETPVSQPELAKKYPFILITGARFRPMHHSEHRQIRSLRKLHPHPIAEINPETARQLGIGDGEWVVIETPRGTIKQKAKLTSRIAPRMVESQHGWWFPEEIGEDPTLFGVFQSNVNVLTPDSEEFCDPATGAVTFGPLLCKIYPLKKYA